MMVGYAEKKRNIEGRKEPKNEETKSNGKAYWKKENGW